MTSKAIALTKRPTRIASKMANDKIKEYVNREDTDEIDVEKLMVDDDSDITEREYNTEGPRIKFTKIHLNQIKMMKRKIVNCEKDDWITVNKNRGTYLFTVYTDIKTGLYELLKLHFLEFMKMVNITLKDESDPRS